MKPMGTTMASDKGEYWIAGGHDELKSLEDLKVIVLAPHSDVPHRLRSLKGQSI